MLDVIKTLSSGQCYAVKTGDDFLSEYPLKKLERMQKLTNFTGSNGIALFFANNKKILLTDSRYTLQAQQELSDFEIVDMSLTKFSQILLQNCVSKIIINTKLFSHKFCQEILKLNITIQHSNEDESVLKIDYKNLSQKFINFDDEVSIFGETSKDKMQKLYNFMRQSKVKKLLITDPHNIAYLLNKRGSDSANTPIKYCFMLVFVNNGVCEYKIFDNDNLYDFVLETKNQHIGLFNCSQYVFNLLENANCKISFLHNVVEDWMVVKNEIELENIRKIARLDSNILNKFFCDIKSQHSLDEILIAEKLYHERQKHKEFINNSFDTICGFAANGAIVHYKASKKTCKKIENNGLLLIDSGGQFKGGTTDTTRVLLFGKAKQEWKTNYTLVLKGHIALASAVFKVGTSGALLDILARQFLWQNGLDYRHGTGHGIGYMLSVHEGSGVGISQSANKPLAEGMIISNEPGFYKQGEYGIRLENMMEVANSSYKGFLCFKMLTFIAFENDLINKSILTQSEIQWLEWYNSNIV